MASTTIKQKLRQRRQARAFERALHDASPSMQSELLAMAARQNFVR